MPYNASDRKRKSNYERPHRQKEPNSSQKVQVNPKSLLPPLYLPETTSNSKTVSSTQNHKEIPRRGSKNDTKNGPRDARDKIDELQKAKSDLKNAAIQKNFKINIKNDKHESEKSKNYKDDRKVYYRSKYKKSKEKTSDIEKWQNNQRDHEKKVERAIERDLKKYRKWEKLSQSAEKSERSEDIHVISSDDDDTESTSSITSSSSSSKNSPTFSKNDYPQCPECYVPEKYYQNFINDIHLYKTLRLIVPTKSLPDIAQRLDDLQKEDNVSIRIVESRSKDINLFIWSNSESQLIYDIGTGAKLPHNSQNLPYLPETAILPYSEEENCLRSMINCAVRIATLVQPTIKKYYDRKSKFSDGECLLKILTVDILYEPLKDNLGASPTVEISYCRGKADFFMQLAEDHHLNLKHYNANKCPESNDFILDLAGKPGEVYEAALKVFKIFRRFNQDFYLYNRCFYNANSTVLVTNYGGYNKSKSDVSIKRKFDKFFRKRAEEAMKPVERKIIETSKTPELPVSSELFPHMVKTKKPRLIQLRCIVPRTISSLYSKHFEIIKHNFDLEKISFEFVNLENTSAERVLSIEFYGNKVKAGLQKLVASLEYLLTHCQYPIQEHEPSVSAGKDWKGKDIGKNIYGREKYGKKRRRNNKEDSESVFNYPRPPLKTEGKLLREVRLLIPNLALANVVGSRKNLNDLRMKHNVGICVFQKTCPSSTENIILISSYKIVNLCKAVNDMMEELISMKLDAKEIINYTGSFVKGYKFLRKDYGGFETKYDKKEDTIDLTSDVEDDNRNLSMDQMQSNQIMNDATEKLEFLKKIELQEQSIPITNTATKAWIPPPELAQAEIRNPNYHLPPTQTATTQPVTNTQVIQVSMPVPVPIPTFNPILAAPIQLPNLQHQTPAITPNFLPNQPMTPNFLPSQPMTGKNNLPNIIPTASQGGLNLKLPSPNSLQMPSQPMPSNQQQNTASKPNDTWRTQYQRSQNNVTGAGRNTFGLDQQTYDAIKQQMVEELKRDFIGGR